MTVIRFKETQYLDKTLYYQCREYVKLCLMVEELQCFSDDNADIESIIKDTDFKASLLLMEFRNSLNRIKKKEEMDNL